MGSTKATQDTGSFNDTHAVVLAKKINGYGQAEISHATGHDGADAPLDFDVVIAATTIPPMKPLMVFLPLPVTLIMLYDIATVISMALYPPWPHRKLRGLPKPPRA